MKQFSILILALTFLFVSHLTTKAQTAIVGGSFSALYIDGFNFQTHALGGYEFNDKLSLGGGIGFDLYAAEKHTIAAGFAGLFFRYTPWHNDVIYIDLKFRTEALLNEKIFYSLDIGIVPSLRFRIAPHWDIFADVGSIGARMLEGEWFPCVGVTNSGCSVGVFYRFK